jgi:hypothetical protein
VWQNICEVGVRRLVTADLFWKILMFEAFQQKMGKGGNIEIQSNGLLLPMNLTHKVKV